MMLALDKAVLAALFAEGVMYGMCMIMGIITALLFLRGGAEGGVMHKRLLSALLLMLVLATAHITIAGIRAFQGFIIYADKYPGGPSEYFAVIGNHVFIAKMIILVLQTVLGDSVNVSYLYFRMDGFIQPQLALQIWRCYVVFGRKKAVIALPLLLMVAGFACACMIWKTQEHAPTDSSVFGLPSPWIKSFHTIMLVTVLYCNCAIAWKIYSSGNLKTSLNNLFPVLLAIIETGVIYTSSLVAFIATYFAESNGQYITVDLIAPLVPIIFCLLILRVNFYRADYITPELSTVLPQVTEDCSQISWRGVHHALELKTEANSSSVPPLLTPVQSVSFRIHSAGTTYLTAEAGSSGWQKETSEVK
ncbi:hypothetical protein EVG20_g1891 [Dentipellis fragilis]|uniref:Uncharacterized protein n=1 Tax=Dentipellis fragilis TaxID=205917 RepID=A0A4Y9ZCI5_9AGAM|nr:hypothetical protein EVG20_g1891 [Dentipellis fragilis]